MMVLDILRSRKSISNLRLVLILQLVFISASCTNGILPKFNKGRGVHLSVDSLYYRDSGFRYVIVDGNDWWVSRLVVQDSTIEISDEDRRLQKQGSDWKKSLVWLTVNKVGDSLTVSVDAEKRLTYGEEFFRIDIQNRKGLALLKGVLGEVQSGKGGEILLAKRSVMFNRIGGKVRIPIKGGDVNTLTVDGKSVSRGIAREHDLNNYVNDWLTVYCEPGKWLDLEATENPSKDIRTFSISLVHFDSYAHIRGFQQAAIEILPSDTIGFIPSKVYFPLEGGSVEVVAQTDGWVLDEKSYGLEWLTIEQDSNRLKLTATPNFDYEGRYFYLRFRKGNYYEYLEGEQERK